MIAGQTHKSSINPQGVKEALFSSSRQTSQTEHHHKPRPPSHLHLSITTSPIVFALLSFILYSSHFLLLSLTFLSIHTYYYEWGYSKMGSRLPCSISYSRLASPCLPLRGTKQVSLVTPSTLLIWVPGLWVMSWRRHRSICQRRPVSLIKPTCCHLPMFIHRRLSSSTKEESQQKCVWSLWFRLLVMSSLNPLVLFLFHSVVATSEASIFSLIHFVAVFCRFCQNQNFTACLWDHWPK